MNSVVGRPQTRIDGPAKVRGEAKYAADFDMPRLAHALLVQSDIANGRIVAIHSKRATALPGVLLVMTHENAPRLPAEAQEANPPGERALSLLQDANVRYNGEPVAVIVAESPEIARHAALLLDVAYAPEAAALNFKAAQKNAYAPPALTHGKADVAWGDTKAGLGTAEVTHEATYTTPMSNTCN